MMFRVVLRVIGSKVEAMWKKSLMSVLTEGLKGYNFVDFFFFFYVVLVPFSISIERITRHLSVFRRVSSSNQLDSLSVGIEVLGNINESNEFFCGAVHPQ